MIDAAAKQDQLEIEKSRIEAQKEIAGLQVGSKAHKDKLDLESKMQLEGLRIGADVARNKAQMTLQERQAMRQALAHANKPKTNKGD